MGEKARVFGYKVTVEDTIGAGDSFTAGFAYRYLKQDSLFDCCEFGNLMGAAAATKKGGMSLIESNDIEDIQASKCSK